MNSDELIAAQQARQADPSLDEEARRRNDAINARLDLQGMNELRAKADNATAPRAKVVLLRRMVDKLGEAARGLTPCKQGCNHCCHMATLVTVEEATAIAKATGAPMTMPTEFNAVFSKEELRDRYLGVPCTFLTSNGCDIYAERPLACRMHHTLDSDNLLCQIVPGHPVTLPSFNTRQLDMAILLAHGGPTKVRYADIREFFPTGLNKPKG